MSNLIYTLLGLAFGFVLSNAQVISWFKVQEMFRFQGFHMYGVIMSAVFTGALLVFLFKKLKVKSLTGGQITIPDKKFNWGMVYGGTLFGIGWAFTGACPGPMYALIGNGAYPIIFALFSAIVGTWVYGYLKPKLPH